MLDVTVSESETSGIGAEEEGELKEPGMGRERGVGRAREVRAEELARDGGVRLGVFLVNLPVLGSLISLLIKKVADGNQRSNGKWRIRCEERTLGLPHWGSQYVARVYISPVRMQGRLSSDHGKIVN